MTPAQHDHIVVAAPSGSWLGAPDIVGLANGRFVVVWVDGSGDGDIRAQIFATDGIKIGETITLSLGRWQGFPTVMASPDGGFSVAFESDNGLDTDLYMQRFTADGLPVGSMTLVPSSVHHHQYQPDSAGLLDGGSVVVWTDARASTSPMAGDRMAVFGQVTGADGRPLGPEIVVNAAHAGWQGGASVTGLAGGGFVVTWTVESVSPGAVVDHEIHMQAFAADGSRRGDEVQVNLDATDSQVTSSVTALTDGGWAVAWTDWGGITSDVHVRLFGPDGQPVTGEVTPHEAEEGWQSFPTGVTLPDGGFVVVWLHSNDLKDVGWDGALHARAFDAQGAPRGEEIVVAPVSLVSYGTYAASVLPDGRVAVTWAQKDDGYSVQTAIIDPPDHGLKLMGQTGNDALIGSAWNDRIEGGLGHDRLDGGAGTDWLQGGGGNDSILGGAGDDSLFGGSGDDRLTGGDGGDTLAGDGGHDLLWGGGGADIFQFARSGGRDRILDWDEGVDQMDLRAFGITTERQALARARTVGDDTVFLLGKGALLWIEDVRKVDLRGDDFIL